MRNFASSPHSCSFVSIRGLDPLVVKPEIRRPKSETRTSALPHTIANQIEDENDDDDEKLRVQFPFVFIRVHSWFRAIGGLI